jgi:GT2 family glycosyltransferase
MNQSGVRSSKEGGAIGPAISVVIVSYRCAETLPECVGRVLATELAVEVLIVDNGPGDGSVSALHGALAPLRTEAAGRAGRWRVIEQPGNPGFARACNLAAAQAQGQWLLLLNPDCYLPPATLSRLHAEAKELSELGLLGVLLEDARGRAEGASLRRDPVPLRALISALGGARLARALGRPDWQVAISPPRLPGLIEVDAISGALMLIRRDRYLALNGLDEGYFLHCEDLDLCRRARAAGWRNYVDTRLRVPHWKGTSSASQPLSVAWHKHRGMLRYYHRFDRAGTGWPLHLLLLTGAWTRILLQSPWLALRQGLRKFGFGNRLG